MTGIKRAQPGVANRATPAALPYTCATTQSAALIEIAFIGFAEIAPDTLSGAEVIVDGPHEIANAVRQ